MPRRLLHLRPWRRHSLVLAVAGIVYMAYGAAMLTVDPARTRVSGLTLALSIMSFHAWGIVWIIVGLLAFLSTRWPPQSETWGYAAMSGLAAFWSACYGIGVLVGLPVTGITACLVWAMVAFMWWAISGLVNPDDIHKPVVFDWTIHGPQPRKDPSDSR